MPRARAAFLCLSLACAPRHAAAASTNTPAKSPEAADQLRTKIAILAASNAAVHLRPVSLVPALAAWATTNHIPLAHFDTFVPTNRLTPGDAITALVTFFEKGGRRTQWLLDLHAAVPTAKEMAAKRPDPMIMYANTGAKEVLVSLPAPVRLRILGPFAEAEPKRRAPKPEDQNCRFTLDEGFLSLGLDNAASAFYRLQERPATNTSGHGFLAFGSAPFPEDKIAEGQKMVARIGITTNEVSALLRAFPAMMSFFGIVEGTAGLEDILMKVVDSPSMLSVLRQRGVNANFKFPSGHIAPAASADWGLPGQPPAWYLPMQLELNGKLALILTFVVTDPSPPLLPCAGVVGFLAQKPDDPETYLTFRVISATRAGSTPR